MMEATDLYAAHRAECMPRIFKLFNLPYVPGDDVANAGTANDAFVGPEHGLLNVPCTTEQQDAARDDLVTLGFATPQTPAHHTFDGGTYVYAAVSPANLRRSNLWHTLEAEGYDLGNKEWLSGQRPLVDRDGDPTELLKGICPDVLDHVWYRTHILNLPVMDNWGLTEFHVTVGIELAQVMATGVWPTYQIVDAFNDKPVKGVPARDILAVRITRAGGDTVTVHNGAAVERPKGDPRPTTDSSTEELIRRYPHLLASGTDVLCVNGNPHADRMQDNVRRLLAANGRTPTLHLAATALEPSHPRFVLNSLHELGIREYNAYLLAA